MTSTEIRIELSSLEVELAPLLMRKARLIEALNEALSREWIAANGVTMRDVQMSDGDDLPWFGHIRSYADWLAENSTKRWAEWNGRIYSTAELLAGRMGQDAPGRIEHVPK